MSQVYNFSAGPAMLPVEVMARAKEEFIDWHGCGMSVMELSHRSKDYMAVAEQAEADLRELMSISDKYAVLFLQGGATQQFAMVPLNMLRGGKKADYFDTGAWSRKAIAEAKRFADVNIVASTKDSGYDHVPQHDEWRLSDDARYVHYTPNETIGGLEFPFVPDVGSKPLVADMSSNILSHPIDVNQFGLIYAGAQKNIGPAGLTVVIVRRDLLGDMVPSAPSLFDYKALADNGSMLNTPPTYAWYLAGLVFQWLKDKGGVAAMAEHNKAKAMRLYDAIDGSDFYANPISVKDDRSLMNVPFTLADAKLDKTFLQGAEAVGLMNLKGHRSVGGMRASIYNAMSLEGVEALVDYMAEFERAHA